MKANELRKSILKLAIQGKLVPQNPDDEPASVLLEKIRAEKQKLIKEDKIKKDKTDSIIYKGDDNCYYEKIGAKDKNITDKIPFEIPETWCWCRIKNYCLNIFNGKSPEYSKISTAHKVIGQQANQWNGLNMSFNKYCTSEFAETMSNEFYLNDGDVLLNTLGKGTLGRSGIFDANLIKEKILTDGHIFVFRNLFKFQSEFLLAFFKIIYDNIVKSANGTTNQTFLNLSNTLLWLVPLPPLAEQERIEKEIEKYEPLIAEYDKLEQEKTKLDGEIKDKLKKSILQYAIQGKLVEQDQNDEPASVLLEKIRAEKKAQLDKKYLDSYIYKGDDNCYYEKIGQKVVNITEDISNTGIEIPKNWEWCRLDRIITLLSGRDLTPNDYSNMDNNGIPYITGASNFSDGELLINRWTNKPVVMSKFGDLLITCKGTIGEIAYNNIGEIHIARQVMAINSFVEIKYIEIFLKSYISVLISKAKSMIPGISREDVCNALIPIPPLKEQNRIIKKINIVFGKLKDTV